MQLLLTRRKKTLISTIGDLSVNGTFICNTLEDRDRGLTHDMSLALINKIKVKGKTAIPTGIYEVVIKWSPKHKCNCPHVLKVPGYAEIEIHPGNKPEDTLGCILPGTEDGGNWVSNSKDAYSKLFAKLSGIPSTEQIFITIT